ncbi:MAG: esterase [Nitrospirota bacterium]|nr:esterase [Nitrospirota bacterium]MDE3119619.1 esterase [Nitrospirota bacterium]MDE3226442.1 esterase [Nitrospirota bacterium]MDE3241650.1 esterase [Nitrospirota bacterium]
MRQETIGGLTVRMAGGTDGHGSGNGPLVILLHGFGAPGDDLVPLRPYLDAPHGTRFAFPVGPLSLSMGFGESRAWWMLDLDRIAKDREAGRPRDLSHEVPKGLAEAREKILTLLHDLGHRGGADPKKTVLGGFSQGAMLACDVALRSPRPLAGLVLLSGTLVSQREWEPLMPKRKGLRVLQSHGTQDPLLPYGQAERLRDLLKGAGMVVDWISFRGGHEIPDMVLGRLSTFLRTALAG